MRQAFRGSIFHCLADPGPRAEESAVEHIEDGLLIVEDGRVVQVGDAADLLAGLDEQTPVEDFSGKLIVPGLIDCHVHCPQVDIIASYGEQLLDWLRACRQRLPCSSESAISMEATSFCRRRSRSEI